MNKRTNGKNSKDMMRAAFLLLPLLTALTAAPALQADTVSFGGVQTTIPASGLYFPTSVAVNGSGDVFIADLFNNRVLKVSSAGVQSVVASGLNLPQGVAVDAASDVYIADTFNNRVLKVTPAGAQSIVLSGLNRPMGVALDAANNLFIADAYNQRVIKVTPSGSQSTVGSGLNSPGAVAVDAAGNVYIADTGNNRVVKVAPDGTQTLVTRYVSQPYGVAVDRAGNVFIADTNDIRVIEISPNGTQTTVTNVVRYPYGVAVDPAGSVYIADSDNNRVLELQMNAANFGSLNICPAGQSSPAPCSRSLTLNYHVSTSSNLGTAAVFTQGASNLDFKLTGSTCTGSIPGGGSCSVNVTFAPSAPGLRLGGVEVTDNGGKVLATTPIYGQGQGPAIAYGPGTQTTLAGGLNTPTGVTVDGAGNVFVADFANHRVLKIAPGGSQTQVGSGLRFPSSVAVDGAGNVFISETGNNRVVEVRARGGEQTVVIDGLILPQGITLDGAGNLFIADYGNNRVVKILAANGAQSTVGSLLKLPYSVAVDAAGNVFIADYGNNRVVRVAPNGSMSPVPVAVNSPTGVAVDAAGTLFIADNGNNRVLEVPSIGAPPLTVATGLSHPGGVAVDATGNIFIADSSNNRVVEMQRSLAPTLNFSTTLVGKTNGPQTVIIQNIGNQPLNAVTPGVTVGANFQQSLLGQDCNSRISLPPSATCNLSIAFVPLTGGNLQSTAVLTDNAMNAAAATQTIKLSGTAMFPTTTTAQAAKGQYSDPVTLSAVVGPAGMSFAGTLQFQVAGVAACSVTVTGSGTYSCSYTITRQVSGYSINATLTSSDPSVQGSSGFGTLTVIAEDATILPSTLNPKTVQANSSGETGPFSLQGTLRQAADGSLGDLSAPNSVSVNLISGSTSIACPAGSTAGGQITAICRLVPVGIYTVQWSTTGRYYQATTVNTTLSVIY